MMEKMVTRMQDVIVKAFREEKAITVNTIKLLNTLVGSGCYPQLEGARDKAKEQWKARQESKAKQRDDQRTHSTKSDTDSSRTANSHVPATNAALSSATTQESIVVKYAPITRHIISDSRRHPPHCSSINLSPLSDGSI
jgi:hypothetical protein